MTEKEDKQKKWIDKIYMLRENELWLNEQAGKGCLLKNFDKQTAYFTEAAAEDIKYKIIVLNNKKAENQIKIIELQGFTFIGSYDEFYIFYINGKYGHIEPRLNEEMIEFVRRWFNKQMIKRFSVTMIAMTSIVINIIFNWNNFFQSIVEIPTKWYIFFGLIYIALIIYAIREYRALISTKKCFLEHEEYLLNRSSKTPTVIRAFLITIGILVGISFLKEIYFPAADRYSIDDVRKVMPIVLLQDITDSQSTINEDNYAEIKHTLMASKQYYASQKNAGNNMSIFYYEVAVEKLAEPLARELSINSLTDIKKENLKKVDIGGLDAVYTWQVNDFFYVSACKGKRVMYIFNVGDIQVDDILRKMAEVL